MRLETRVKCFCGFETLQKEEILEASTLVKFRERIGAEGMLKIEQVLLKAWSEMGLAKTKRVSVDSTSQPKNIAYPTDADLLHRIKEKIVHQIERVREEVTLRKPFRSYKRTAKRLLFGIKRLCRSNPEKRKETTEALRKIVNRVVHQAAGVVNTLYAGAQGCGPKPQPSCFPGKENHRADGAGASRREAEAPGLLAARTGCGGHPQGQGSYRLRVGSLVSLVVNEDNLVLSHAEYQDNRADFKTLHDVTAGMAANTGNCPEELGSDRGFSQSLKKQERMRKRLNLRRLAIPRKGKSRHLDHHQGWFKEALKRRVKIEPIIGHLKHDHLMGCCRYKGKAGDTANVVWATLAWNTKKIVSLHGRWEEKRNLRERRVDA
jgi:transposase, IS5 family